MVMKIADRLIGADHPPYVIAEMSGNHNGDIERAKKLILAAKNAGADAVKLQTYTADTITIPCDRPEFQITSGLWQGRSLHELYDEAHTPWEWHAPLFAYAKDVGITVFSSPFDPTAVDFLEELDAPAYKVASPEVIDWGLLKKIASTGKPVIISSGMATDQEMIEAINVLKEAGCQDIVALHCISAYPTPLDQANLKRITHLKDILNVNTGLSDHSMGLTAAAAAVSMGACVVEKHFTLTRADGGVDSAFSLEEHELADLCKTLKEIHGALGSAGTELAQAEAATRQFRRSLYFVQSLQKGDIVTSENVRSIRPGMGLLPRYLDDIMGKKVNKDIDFGTPTDWSFFDDLKVTGH